MYRGEENVLFIFYLVIAINVAPLNTPLASSRFPTVVSQLPPSIDGGCFGKVCRVLLFLLLLFK